MKFNKFLVKTFDNKGYGLTPMELREVAPFEVKRVYFFDLKENLSTSQHCHKEELEVFVQIQGSSKIIVDRGNGKEEISLEKRGEAVYVPAYVWHGFVSTSADCLIMALSSTNYRADRSDYIEDYEAYLKVRDQNLQI